MIPIKIRVVIADDHALIRLGIRRLLECSPDILVVGEARDGQETVLLVEELTPDVLVLDLQMPVLDGIEVMAKLQQCGIKVRTLILSAYNDPCHISVALERGAWGYYVKDNAPEVIVEAVRSAARGEGKGRRPPLPPKKVTVP